MRLGLLLTAVLTAFWAGAPSAPLAQATPTKPLRILCVDSAFQLAECGNGLMFNECLFSDAFGRCPNDPTCFDQKAQQVRCVGSVKPVTGQCNDGRVIHYENPAAYCAAHGGLAAFDPARFAYPPAYQFQ